MHYHSRHGPTVFYLWAIGSFIVEHSHPIKYTGVYRNHGSGDKGEGRFGEGATFSHVDQSSCYLHLLERSSFYSPKWARVLAMGRAKHTIHFEF